MAAPNQTQARSTISQLRSSKSSETPNRVSRDACYSRIGSETNWSGLGSDKATAENACSEIPTTYRITSIACSTLRQELLSSAKVSRIPSDFAKRSKIWDTRKFLSLVRRAQSFSVNGHGSSSDFNASSASRKQTKRPKINL